jgi:hypothetical protein
MDGAAWKINSGSSCTYTYNSKRYMIRIGDKAYPLAGINEAVLLLTET